MTKRADNYSQWYNDLCGKRPTLLSSLPYAVVWSSSPMVMLFGEDATAT